MISKAPNEVPFVLCGIFECVHEGRVETLLRLHLAALPRRFLPPRPLRIRNSLEEANQLLGMFVRQWTLPSIVKVLEV